MFGYVICIALDGSHFLNSVIPSYSSRILLLAIIFTSLSTFVVVLDNFHTQVDDPY